MTSVGYAYNPAHNRVEPVPRWDLVAEALPRDCEETMCCPFQTIGSVFSHHIMAGASWLGIGIGLALNSPTVVGVAVGINLTGSICRITGLGNYIYVSERCNVLGISVLAEMIPGLVLAGLGYADQSLLWEAGLALTISSSSRFPQAAFWAKKDPEEKSPLVPPV